LLGRLASATSSRAWALSRHILISVLRWDHGTKKNGRCTVKHSALTEHWTYSRRALVLEGTPEAIDAVVSALSIPNTHLVILSPSRAIVGLWDEWLGKYIGHRATRKTNSNGYHSTPGPCQDLPFQSRDKMRYDRQTES
jgi:hypothetical protein